MVSETFISVEVVFSPGPRVIRQFDLQVAIGSTIAGVLRTSEVLRGLTAEEIDALSIGVWGHKAGPGQVVNDRDRIEIYRPLRVDPKVARRERFVRQGARSTGLFARRRAGGKDGY